MNHGAPVSPQAATYLIILGILRHIVHPWMETIKCHWNSVLSTPGAKYCTADISNMYLCSELPDAQYVRFNVSMIPPEIIDHYKLNDKIYNGFVYAKIKQAWYGLKEAAYIAHQDLVKHLKKIGYNNRL